MPQYDRILITGAAGRLGSEHRKGLAPLAKTIRLADRQPIGNLAPNEEEAIFDLADMDATIAATEGCDAIVLQHVLLRLCDGRGDACDGLAENGIARRRRNPKIG